MEFKVWDLTYLIFYCSYILDILLVLVIIVIVMISMMMIVLLFVLLLLLSLVWLPASTDSSKGVVCELRNRI